MAYDIGDKVRFRVAFTDLDDQPTDPDGVTVKIINPAGVQTTYVYGASIVERTGVGLYNIEIEIDASGIWRHKWFGTGSLMVAEEDCISVRSTHFT